MLASVPIKPSARTHRESIDASRGSGRTVQGPAAMRSPSHDLRKRRPFIPAVKGITRAEEISFDRQRTIGAGNIVLEISAYIADRAKPVTQRCGKRAAAAVHVEATT